MILVTMRRGLSVFAALGMAVVAGACSSSTPPVHPEASSVATSSSGLVLGGRVRCTATMQTPVQAGHETGLTFALRNLTDHPVRVSVTPYSLWFVLKAADGTRYDTRVPFEGESMPGSIPSTIRPGRTKTVRQSDVRVRWAGPLSITPACEQTRLPRLRTNVAAAGPAPAERKAIADVAAASGHLLDRCGPSRAGVQVKGWIDPPSGNALPMRARCSIRLERQGRFVVAQVLVLIPPDLEGVRVEKPYEQVTLPDHGGTAEAIAWEFVVTADGAVPVASGMEDTTRPANVMAPDWDWAGTHWEGPGGSRCGGNVITGGGGPDATIEFVSVCPA